MNWKGKCLTALLVVSGLWLDKPAFGDEAINRPIKDKWALVIGINKFKNEKIPTLRYSVKDAEDFAQFLIEKGNFARDHILVLTDENATYKNIMAALGDKWFPRRVMKDDCFDRPFF